VGQSQTVQVGAFQKNMEDGQLPHVTPGLVCAAALPPPDEDAGDLCRICFGPDESEASGNPADQFISPCKCSGEPWNMAATGPYCGRHCRPLRACLCCTHTDRMHSVMMAMVHAGSIAYIHCSCLVAWRQQRCAEQGFRRSQQCEM
jgi:hypothetical protein